MTESIIVVKLGGTDGGPVEVDETYIGGRARFMNAKQRDKIAEDAEVGVGHQFPHQAGDSGGHHQRQDQRHAERARLQLPRRHQTPGP